MYARSLLALVLVGCTCSDPPAAGAPAPEAEAPEVEAAEPAATAVAPALEAPAVDGQTQVRAARIRAMGGYALGQSLAEAEARCVAERGTFAHVERAIHRCTMPASFGELATNVDVALAPGTETVGRIVVAYRSAEPGPLVPLFVTATTGLSEAFGPSRSEAETERCATGSARQLRSCLEEQPQRVQQSWSTTRRLAGDAPRMGAADLEDVALSIGPSSEGSSWDVVAQFQRRGYEAAFLEAFAE